MASGTVACEARATRETLVSLPLAAISGARDNAEGFPGQDPKELPR